MKKKTALLCGILVGLSMLFGQATNADSAPGDVVITLGENLTVEQREVLMGKMGTDDKSLIIEVTNSEEHKYLGNYLPKTKIGTKALSSAKITIGNDGDGITVTSDNINWVTEDMYINALSTAGVKDAAVYVTAPFPVSGTAALTGLLKAYETTMEIEIPEEQKQVANEELVKTAQLGDSIGSSEKATELMSLVKAGIAENKPNTEEELRQIILDAATQLGIQLPEDQLQGLIDLFNKMKELNIDWNAVGENLTVAKEKLDNFLNQEETQNVIQKMGDFFVALVDAIKSWFN